MCMKCSEFESHLCVQDYSKLNRSWNIYSLGTKSKSAGVHDVSIECSHRGWRRYNNQDPAFTHRIIPSENETPFCSPWSSFSFSVLGLTFDWRRTRTFYFPDLTRAPGVVAGQISEMPTKQLSALT